MIYDNSTWWWSITNLPRLSTVRVMHDNTDPNYRADIGRITTTPTGWKIGSSNQNNCSNVHIRGQILQFPGKPIIQDASYLGGFYVNLGYSVRSNYIIDLNEPFTFIEVGSVVLSSGAVRHYRCLCYNITVGDCICYGNSTINLDEINGQFPAYAYEQTYSWDAKWTFLKSQAGHTYLGSQTWTTGVRLTYKVNWVTMEAELLSTPSLDQLHTNMYYYYIRHGRNAGFYLESALVYPPNAEPKSLRWDITYDLDSAMASALAAQVDFTTSNGIAYALDAKDIVSSAKNDLESLRALTQGAPGKLKIASSLFLSFHYGWKLMAADTAEFAEAFREFSRTSNRRVHFSTTGTALQYQIGGYVLRSAVAHRSIYYDPYGQISNQAFALAEAMDLVPDLSNVWDMIPFSFVVDWFTNIGDLATGLDALMTLVQEHKVLGTITSTKEVYEYHVVGGFGQYEYIYYDRTCIKDWYPLPEFSFQLKNPLSNLTHWCEAGALVVATRP